MTRIFKSKAADATPRIDDILPDAALPGGEFEIHGEHLGPQGFHVPQAVIGEQPAPVALSRGRRMVVRVPESASTGILEVYLNGSRSNGLPVKVAREIAANLHVVANPALDDDGNLYVTLSGPRGQQTPVSVYRISPRGNMEAFLSGLMNATGLAVGADHCLYVSSRHDGTVHRVTPAGASSLYAEGMGVATGIAFDAAGNLYVGDRSGTIFKIAPDRQIFVFATLEPSIAAYHLAFGPDETLFVTGPTTSSFDSVYAIDRSGTPRIYFTGLGRPQGLAADVEGNLYVVGSYRGRRGVVRVTPSLDAELVLSGPGLVGLAFDPDGNTVIATNTAVYDVPLGIEGLRLF